MMLSACLGYFVQKIMRPKWLPHGPAVKLTTRPSFLEVDLSNDSLQGKHGKLTKIYERLDDNGGEGELSEPLLKGPETVVINPKDGTIYVLTEEALLVSLTDLKPHDDKSQIGDDDTDNATIKTATIMTAKATQVVDLGMGRPLGGRFTSDGKTLYVCDAALGLLRITNPHQFPNKSKVELVAHQFTDKNGIISKIHYANDIAIGSKSGKVYFTDSTDIMSDRIETRTWDTMYASKTDMMRGKRMGRLLEYDPQTNQIRVLVRDLHFANGVGIGPDESFIFVAETFGLRLLKYHLTGSRNGTTETLVESKDMPGFPDGADCNNKRCYAAMPSAIVPLAKLLYKIPHPFDKGLRNIMMMLPKVLVPKAIPYGGVVEVDSTTKELRYFQDPYAEDIGMLAGVTAWDNRLYLGSLTNNFVGVYDLS